MVAIGVSPRNGTWPVNSSKITMPSAYTSLRKSTFSPRACSGLMYSGVPTTTPNAVAPSVASRFASFAMPKSISRTRPRSSIMMLGVFRSRWMIPASWMASSPSAIWMAIWKASPAGSAPRRSSTWRRSTPLMNSIAMKRRSPSSPYSWMPHTFACRTFLASLISWRKRRAMSASRATSERSTLSATSSSSVRSWAL
jgi:hypothetical protein